MEQTQVLEGNFLETQTDCDPQGDSILWELRQPLDMSRVKRRQAPGMGSVPYIEGFDVIDRANTIFNYQWSFALAPQPVVLRWERHVLAWDKKLRKKVPIHQDGQPVTEEVGLVHVTGAVVVEIGGRQHEHADIGRCIFTGDTPEALDMALAGSATDCLKRCFRQLGEQFGNSLYDKEIAGTVGLPNGRKSTDCRNSGNGNHKQPAKAKTPDKDVPRKYADGSNVNGNTSEQDAYDRFIKTHKGQLPASREVLREWVKDNPLRTEEQILKELGYE